MSNFVPVTIEKHGFVSEFNGRKVTILLGSKKDEQMTIVFNNHEMAEKLAGRDLRIIIETIS